MDPKDKTTNSNIRVGAQGWNYDDWTTRAGEDPIFYPRSTRSPAMLGLYAEIFDTVEVDSTFYAIPAASTVENWHKKSRENFVFALKLPREITHERQLRRETYPITDEFCERVAELQNKLGIVLIQLAPQFSATRENAQALRRYLARLPKSIRFAVEFREPSWMVEWTYRELESHGVALALVEGEWIPRETMFAATDRLKANFSYVRFMGDRDLTRFDMVQRPQDSGLKTWAEEIQRIPARDVFVYFSNFYEGHAPASANKLKRLLGQSVTEPVEIDQQGSLF